MHDAASASVPAGATAADGGTLYLVLTQIVSRAFTFVGNQFLLNYLSPSLLGLAVQLEVLSVTILYTSRESLRVALQRQPSGARRQASKSSSSQDVINLAYLAVLVGVLASIAFGYGYLQSASEEVLYSVDFWPAFKLYATGTLIELLAEPCFVVIQQHALYRARARAETMAALARCAGACIAAVIMHARRAHASVIPFAIGQLSYSTALLIAYLAAVLPLRQSEGFSVFPRKVQRPSRDETAPSYVLGIFSKSLLSLTATFYGQSVFKLLLTQGDSLILSFLTDLKSQGAFALASNYGGLLSRLILQPVEESSRNVFGRLLATAVEQYDADRGKTPASTTRNVSSDPLFKALSHLTTTLHIYTLLSLPLVSILPPILPTLSTVLLRPQWRTLETTSLLTAYLYYIPFLALNGVLDAFVTSVATPYQLRLQSFLMAIVTAIYGAVAWTLMGTSESAEKVRALLFLPWGGDESPLGSTGLVYANIVNMALRIAYSTWFISVWVSTRPGKNRDTVRSMWTRSLPGASTIIVAVAVGSGLRRVLPNMADNSSLSRNATVLHGLSLEDIGYVFGGITVLGSSILVCEHRFLLDIMIPLIPRRFAAKITPYLHEVGGKQA